MTFIYQCITTFCFLLSQISATEFCEDQTFVAECGSRSVIVMTTAHYGRMKINKCLSQKYGEPGCFENLRYYFDSRCSGLHTCEVKVHSLFEISKPCGQDLRSYLDATYTCQDVTMPSAPRCLSGNPAELNDPGIGSISGVLSGLVTESTGCGSVDSPWLIKAAPGRQIRISLVDYSIPSDEDLAAGVATAVGTNDPSICRVLAVIRESGQDGTSKTICWGGARGEKKRDQLIYDGERTPGSDGVEVRFLQHTQEEERRTDNFLIKYTVYGCANLPLNQNTKMERTRDGGVILCNNLIKWTLKCVNNHWQGEWRNCSSSGSGKGTGSNVAASQDEDTSELGMAVATFFGLPSGTIIAAVVVIAVLIGALVLVVGICCVKKRTANGPPDAAKYSTGRHFDAHPPPYDDMYTPEAHKHLELYRQLATATQRDSSGPAQTSHMIPAPYAFAGGSSGAGSGTIYGGDERYVEHIYESPKFSRRDMDGGIRKDNPTHMSRDMPEYPFIPDVLVSLSNSTEIS